MIASLAMYDRQGQSLHWDAFWGHVRDALRARGIAAPDALTRGGNYWDHWGDPALILGQTCGMPYRQRLHGKVHLVGTLDHGLEGAPAGYYYSVLVAHRDRPGDASDLAEGSFAYNAPDSESGWAAAHTYAARRGFRFRPALHTGTHSESARAVAAGRADIASIDAETWRLIETWEPEVAGALRILTRTDPTPGLPLITGLRHDAQTVYDAVEEALGAAGTATLDALHIKGIVRIPAAAYLAVPTPDVPLPDAQAV